MKSYCTKQKCNYEKDKPNFSKEKLLQFKQLLFEIRFANTINQTKYSVQNEFKTGIGNTDVDFKVTDDDKQEWLIELTSPVTSAAVTKNTKVLDNGLQSYNSSSNSGENSAEVLDIIKTQDVIFSKVANDAKPIKFPLITESKAYHIIVISINSFNNYMSDDYDFKNIAYGSKHLVDVDDGIYCRYYNGEMIKGVFDTNHINPKAKVLQERVHAICFIKEDFELKKTIKRLCVNPKLSEDKKATIVAKFEKIIKN